MSVRESGLEATDSNPGRLVKIANKLCGGVASSKEFESSNETAEIACCVAFVYTLAIVKTCSGPDSLDGVSARVMVPVEGGVVYTAAYVWIKIDGHKLLVYRERTLCA